MTASKLCFRDPAGARIFKTESKRVRWATSAILLAFPWMIGLAADASAQNISVAGGDVESNVAPTTYDSITVSGTSALGAPSTYTAAADLTLTNSLSVSSSGVFNANANVTAGGVSISSDGLINLNTGTLTAGGLGLSGPNSVTRTDGHYSVGNLSLSNGAALTYGDGDSISGELTLDGASLARTKTLNAYAFNVQNTTLDLITGDSFYATSSIRTGSVVNINGDVTLGGVETQADGKINLNVGTLTAGGLGLSGPNSVTRTDGHYSVGNLYLSNGAALTYGDGDSISGEITLDGASLARTKTFNAYAFKVTNTTLDLTTGDSFYATSSIRTGGVVNINGDVTLRGVGTESDGVVNLNSGTLTAVGLGLSGPNSVTRTGGHYSVGDLSLSNGAALTYGDGDSISNALSIDGISSLFAEYEPLSLDSLSITNGGVLSLYAFTGSGAVSNWGLRVAGDTRSLLDALIAGNLITGNSGPLSVLYDPTSNSTFVTTMSAVPEIDPVGIGSVITLVTGVLALLERRKRSA